MNVDIHQERLTSVESALPLRMREARNPVPIKRWHEAHAIVRVPSAPSVIGAIHYARPQIGWETIKDLRDLDER